MDKPKRPPPVPKFQEKSNTAAIQQRVESFMSSIKTEAQPPAQQPKKEVKQKPEEGKKKISMASLNSKLNNMLNAKKINISSALTGEAEKEKKEKEQKQRRSEAEYDPQCPNNYQMSKHQYLKVLETQTESDWEEEEKSQEMAKEEESEMVVEQDNFSEEKEQTALRMMQKFGYKLGEGLGKQGQGIKTPLVVKKTNESSGVIEQSRIPLNYLITPEISAKNALSVHNIQAESVIVLTGVAELKQLEQGVQKEIREECQSFGTVVDWVNYFSEGQLRIFTKFQTAEEAFKAFVAMNGKYFGEKFVSVRFYSESQFAKRQMDTVLHPHIPT